MRGFPLEKQLTNCGATFIREDTTSPKYEFFKLHTAPAKPGLVRRKKGVSVSLEIWKMPLEKLGYFATLVKPPLSLGNVELQNGSEVLGFLCEAYATEDAENISNLANWKLTK
jgi:allophanate hydrolase